jgi:electron transfer flavoprotein alpha subunit
MTVEGWVIAASVQRLGAMVSAVRGMGAGVMVAAVGPRSVAEAAAAAGPDAVAWIETAEDVPAEAYASALARVLAAAKPRAVLATTAPQDRALLGAAGAALGAVVIPGILRMSLKDGTVVVDRTDLRGRVVETLTSAAPVAGLFGGEDDIPPPAPATSAPIDRLEVGSRADIRIEKTEPSSGAGTGVTSAERVVAVGRGLKAKADLALVEGLAAALGAEIGCSMPIADDFGWVAKERYIGRSGQHISPRLYVAIGISGAPQHLDGVRDAKVVVAINTDPRAIIFRRTDYGIVGDLYEVIPALRAALGEYQSSNSERGKQS